MGKGVKSMANPVKSASVGIGWWSNVLADAVQKSETLEIVTCFTRNPEKRADFAEKYGCRESESYEAILKDPEVEAILLTTPHTAHREQIEGAARSGKQVFVEKPLAHTVADSKAAVEACEKAGVVLSVGHSRRRQEGIRKLKELIEAEMLGQVISAEAHYSTGMALAVDQSHWRASRVENPGGALTSVGIHHLDTMAYLLGPIQRVSGFAKRQATPTELDDTVSAILEFESGPLGYLGSNFVLPHVFYLNVYGTEANAFSDDVGKRLFLQRKGSEEREPVELKGVDIVFEEIDEFGRCIRSGERPEASGEEGIRAVAAIEAIMRSAEEGRIVELGELL
jgi:predicted dehydrogenase